MLELHGSCSLTRCGDGDKGFRHTSCITELFTWFGSTSFHLDVGPALIMPYHVCRPGAHAFEEAHVL